MVAKIISGKSIRGMLYYNERKVEAKEATLLAGAAAEVQLRAPEGQKIGRIKLPEICANLCFGGSRRNRLFMTASQSLYSLYVDVKGAAIA